MAIGNAQDNLVGSTSVEIIQNDYIEDRPAFSLDQSQSRISQQRIAPSAVSPRFIAPVQEFQLLNVGFTLVPDSSSVIVTTITQNNSQQSLVQIVARQVYVGAFDASGRMPEVISSRNFPHYDWDTFYAGRASIDDIDVSDQPWVAVHRIQVRNSSGSTQAIAFQLLAKFIANQSDGAQRTR
jgi:hypothetical protein